MPPRKYFCTFPQELISEPIISYTLGEKFDVVPNIRAASITDTIAMVAVEIEGAEDAIEQAVNYLKERGVRVEEITEGDETPHPPTDLKERGVRVEEITEGDETPHPPTDL